MSSTNPLREEASLIGVALLAFAAVGIWIGLSATDVGIVTSWLWFTLGLSATYLLSRAVIALEHLAYGP